MTPNDNYRVQAGTPTDDVSALNDQAAQWVVRAASGTMSADEQQALEDWKSASPAHLDAFNREQQFWQALGTWRSAFVPAVEVAQEPPVPQNLVAFPPRKSRYRWQQLGTVAASLLLVILLFNGAPEGDYRTAAGEIQVVSLPDGSSVFLNTNTAINLNYSEGERGIELLRGEAWFDVAPNTNRPFRVKTHDGVTEAVGTAFNIRALEQQASVTVTSGQVRVSSPLAAETRQSVALGKGYGVDYLRGQPPGEVSIRDIEQVIAWTQGWVELEDLPLADALKELNRYMPGKILLMNTEAGKVVVSGTFRRTQLHDALRGLASTQSLRVVELSPYLTILY
jgi:transmembrane sensor